LRASGSANDHDLGLFALDGAAPIPREAAPRVGLYHLAWEVGTLAELEEARRRLAGRGALVGASDHRVSKSLYAKDPSGIEFEVMWRVPAEVWGAGTHSAPPPPPPPPAEAAAASGAPGARPAPPPAPGPRSSPRGRPARSPDRLAGPPSFRAGGGRLGHLTVLPGRLRSVRGAAGSVTWPSCRAASVPRRAAGPLAGALPAVPRHGPHRRVPGRP